MNYRIPLIKWESTDSERKAIMAVMDSGRLSYGPVSRQFEAEFSRYHNCEYGCISNSGTAALEVALVSLKEKYTLPTTAPIICPAVTFVASLNAIITAGLMPVLSDVDENGYLDPLLLEEVSYIPAGIVLPHLWGNPYPYKGNLMELKRDPKFMGRTLEGLRIIEDSCETIDKRVGNWGDISCFSFYMCHTISAGVGGMSCTNDKDLADIMRSLNNHGMRDINIMPVSERFNFDRVGYSNRVTEFEAALGLEGLHNIEGNLSKRKQVRDWITAACKERKIDERINLIGGVMMYPMAIRDGERLDKGKIMRYLDNAGIETRHLMPLTNQAKLMKSIFGPDFNPKKYPNADKLNRSGFYVPVNQYMTKEDCEYVAESVALSMKI